MRGDIIPTGLKVWTDRERHVIFVVEFRPSQIPPPERLRKSHGTRACWNLLPATYLILLNQHIYPSTYAVTFSWWVLEWLTALCSTEYAVQNESCTIIRTSIVSSDSPGCVDVEASNRIVMMYVNPRNSELWQKDMTTTLMQMPLWRISALRKLRLPLL